MVGVSAACMSGERVEEEAAISLSCEEGRRTYHHGRREGEGASSTASREGAQGYEPRVVLQREGEPLLPCRATPRQSRRRRQKVSSQ